VNDLTKAGVNGHYESDYFGTVDTGSDFGSTLHERRLRAAVQLLNVKFAKEMSEIGHKYKFEGLVSLEDDGSDGDADTPTSSDQYLGFNVPELLCRSKAFSRVQTVLIRTRGRELPGNFNPLLIRELFWEQSENWQELAERVLDEAFHAEVRDLRPLITLRSLEVCLGAHL